MLNRTHIFENLEVNCRHFSALPIDSLVALTSWAAVIVLANDNLWTYALIEGYYCNLLKKKIKK